ncbi:MAG: cupin domain-containing protein [Methanomicrobiales archaeon]|nr:cupin domain-containing protein [Methanomicrobiales archaeon]
MTGEARQQLSEEQPVSLREMVSYQEGSIVSRMLINKPSGTVTLFSFDQGEGLSEHSAPYDAMLINLEGEVEVIIGGKARTVKGGEMIIMPARIPHAVKALTRFMMVLVMIHE